MDQHITLGILLCGGESKRMGKPKSLLNYHGIPQWEFAANQLAEICDAVSISIHSQEQWKELLTNKQPNCPPTPTTNHELWLEDNLSLGYHGPATAFFTVGNYVKQHSQFTHVLVLGVDYPAITAKDLLLLLEESKKQNTIVSFANTEDGNMEPLIACYPANQLESFSSFHSQNPSASPRRYFQSLNPTQLTIDQPIRIKSIDTSETAGEIRTFLAKQSQA